MSLRAAQRAAAAAAIDAEDEASVMKSAQETAPQKCPFLDTISRVSGRIARSPHLCNTFRLTLSLYVFPSLICRPQPP